MEGLLGRLKAADPALAERVEPQALFQRVRQRLEREAVSLVEDAARDPDARARLEALVRTLVVREGYGGADSERVASELVAEISGLGPIDRFMRDPDVTEIMVNGPNQVYVERAGRLEPVDVAFTGPQHVVNTVQRLIAPTGRRLDLGRPFVDARLPDGSRLHAVIPPIAVNGPVVTIRRFPQRSYTARHLLDRGAWSPALCAFLIRCVRARLNILISGGTGSGKTTLLNVLAGFIPRDERILTIEEAAELQIRHPHVVMLEARSANHEGQGEVTLRDLVRNALRMRPDRIIVGEVRGSEALDLLQAWNTGHSGSLSTLHANGPRDALTRLETMVLMSPDQVPLRLAERLVRATVDVIVQVCRRGSDRHIQRVEVRTEAGDYACVFEHVGGRSWRQHPLPNWLGRALEVASIG